MGQNCGQMEASFQVVSSCKSGTGACVTQHAHRRAVHTVLTSDMAAGRSEKRYRSEESDAPQANGHKRSRLHDASVHEGVHTLLAHL